MSSQETFLAFAGIMLVIALLAVAIDWFSKPMRNRKFVPKMYRYPDERMPRKSGLQPTQWSEAAFVLPVAPALADALEEEAERTRLLAQQEADRLEREEAERYEAEERAWAEEQARYEEERRQYEEDLARYEAGLPPLDRSQPEPLDAAGSEDLGALDVAAGLLFTDPDPVSETGLEPDTSPDPIGSDEDPQVDADAPALDEPALDRTALDEPALDEPALDEPALDEPALDRTALDEPALDEPALDAAPDLEADDTAADTEPDPVVGEAAAAIEPEPEPVVEPTPKPEPEPEAQAQPAPVIERTTGWKLGEYVFNYTKSGKEPTAAMVRRRYWRNVAAAKGSAMFGERNRKLMADGKAPQRRNPRTGKMESMRLPTRSFDEAGGVTPIPAWPVDELNPYA